MEPPFHESRDPLGPESPKKSQKGLPPGPGLECRKSGEKVLKYPKKSQRGVKISVRVEISPAIYRAQNPENPKSLKKVSREEFGTPRARTPKKSEKSPKSQENSCFSDFFLTFRTFFGLFGGPGSGGPKLLSGDFFETFRVFGVLGSVDGGGDLNVRDFFDTFLTLPGGGRPFQEFLGISGPEGFGTSVYGGSTCKAGAEWRVGWVGICSAELDRTNFPLIA